ncbi:hypothetical protein [Spirosoma jeollabukense]
MSELEEIYDQRFNTHNRKLDSIYLDALMWLYGYDEQYIKELWDSLTIIPPSPEFEEKLTELADSKRYGDIFGEVLGNQDCIFEPYGVIELKIDDLNVFEFPPSEWLEHCSTNPQALKHHERQIKQYLGPLFPEKIKGYTVVIAAKTDPNGHKLELTTYDDIEGKHIENLFQLYNDWFDNHTQNLTPQFQLIATEVSEWLKELYRVNPSKDGFIEWYMATKMKAGISIRANKSCDGNHDVTLEFKMLQDVLTPAIIEEDLHKYCQWRQQRHEQAQALARIELNENAKLYLSKTPYSTFEDLINFAERWIENFYQSSLDKLNEVLASNPDQHPDILNNALKNSIDTLRKMDTDEKNNYPGINFDRTVLNSTAEFIEKILIPFCQLSHSREQAELQQNFLLVINRIGICKVIWYIEDQITLLIAPNPISKPQSILLYNHLSVPAMPNESEQYITTWIFSLRQKIHIATRWVFQQTEEGKRDLRSTFYLDNVRDELGHFAVALKQQLTQSQNWKAIELDLKAEFIVGIYQYYNWYNENAAYRSFFGIDSPYDIIFNVAQSTEREIVKYFPELAFKPLVSNISSTSALSTVDEQIKLSHSQIAIFHHYIDKPINKNNAEEIANKYGQTSGQKLATSYNQLTSPLVRTSRGKNRVKDINMVLPLLEGKAKGMAEKELKEAKANNEK